MSGALAGLKVVEICDEMGEWAGKLFADMGAEVVKVEPPGGVRTRTYGPFLNDEPGPERSLWFWHYNTNKRSVVADLEQADARAAVKGRPRSRSITVAPRLRAASAEPSVEPEST